MYVIWHYNIFFNMYVFIVNINIKYGAVYFSANIRQQNLREGAETLPYIQPEEMLNVG